MNRLQEFCSQLIDNIERVIVGKREAIELMMVALLCEGHILIEDVPGVGKTMLARSLATSLGGLFKRIQCTPDLLPNDISGVAVYNQGSEQFEFREGPVFVNILLADEINRATPRTQSALLEAMQEQQVTVDGFTYRLPRPFIVLATQNPIEYEGTFPLPEAQLDRFLLRLSLGYPSEKQERQILINLRREHPITTLKPVPSGPDYQADGGEGTIAELLRLQPQVWDVHVDETLEAYIVRLAGATREHPDLALGASPRASLALYKSAQALAALRGRDHVLPEDIKYLVEPALAHRLIIRPEAALRGKSVSAILQDLLRDIPLDIGSYRQ